MKRRSFLASLFASLFAGAAGALLGREAVAKSSDPNEWTVGPDLEDDALYKDGVALNSVAHPVSPGDWYLSADLAHNQGCTAVSLCRVDKGVITIEAVNVFTDEDIEDHLPRTLWWREYLAQHDALLYEIKPLSQEEALQLLELMRPAASDLSERSLEQVLIEIQEQTGSSARPVSIMPQRYHGPGTGGERQWFK